MKEQEVTIATLATYGLRKCTTLLLEHNDNTLTVVSFSARHECNLFSLSHFQLINNSVILILSNEKGHQRWIVCLARIFPGCGACLSWSKYKRWTFSDSVDKRARDFIVCSIGCVYRA